MVDLRSRRTARRPVRTVALTALASLLSGLVVAATPGAAQAAVPCPTTNIEHRTVSGVPTINHLKLVSSVATFDRTDSRSVDNPLDVPVSATFSSQNSTTFTIATSTTVRVEPTLLNFFKLEVSTTITYSKTSSVGVSVTAPVPPHTRLIAEYGISSFDIVYDTDMYIVSGGQCFGPSAFPREYRHAPTVNEGWRLSQVAI